MPSDVIRDRTVDLGCGLHHSSTDAPDILGLNVIFTESLGKLRSVEHGVDLPVMLPHAHLDLGEPAAHPTDGRGGTVDAHCAAEFLGIEHTALYHTHRAALRGCLVPAGGRV